MLYIITEDSNSARSFWNIVAHTFRGERNYILVDFLPDKLGGASSGNTTLKEQFNALIPKLVSGDEVFVVFDNIAETSNFNPVNLISKIISTGNSLGVKVKFTNYYCFEEMYLSYSGLTALCSKNEKMDKVVLNALLYVYAKLHLGEDYFDKGNPYIRAFIEKNKRDTGKNREYFANQLLMKATEIINGYFKIVKSGDAFTTSGQCWTENCRTIQMAINKQHKCNMCDAHCYYVCKNNNTRDKLLHLSKNSLCMDEEG